MQAQVIAAPPRQDAEGRIDDSKACEVTDTRIQYHIAWEGFPDPFPDCWQQLEHDIAATVLSQPEPYRSAQDRGARGRGRRHDPVPHRRRATPGGIWQLHAAHGAELLMDAALPGH